MGLLEQIKAAGVTGCGGAGFPTHVKLDCRVDSLLVNGAECEPLLRTDRWLMAHRADDVITGAHMAARQVGAKEIRIALKESYTEEILALKSAIVRQKSPVNLLAMPDFYPAGDEQAIVLEATGKTVPPGGIPLDVGAVVSNAATMVAVYNAARAVPFTHKYLTVTGAVTNPVILQVPLGASFADCITAAGGALRTDCRVIAGGPLMGKPYAMGEAQSLPVTKTTSGIVLVPPEAELARRDDIPLRAVLRRAKSVCIQCRQCTDLCPRYLSGHPLQPHQIMRKLAYAPDEAAALDDHAVQQALICCECGVCENLACPMGLRPCRVNAHLKAAYAAAGARYGRGAPSVTARPEREWRRVSSRRIAARLGIAAYYDYQIDTMLEPVINETASPLRQHIGAPSVPVVKPGERVTAGQLIAACPETGLGANLHAGIDGVVSAVTEREIRVKGDGGR